MSQQIKTLFKGRPYIVTIDESGVDISPEGDDGKPDPTLGMAVWVDTYEMEDDILLAHAYHAESDAPVTLKLTRNEIQVL